MNENERIKSLPKMRKRLQSKLRNEGDKIWDAIEILTHNLGEKQLALKLREVYDTYYRPGWKKR